MAEQLTHQHIIDQLTLMYHELKNHNDPVQFPLYCYIQCLKADMILIREDHDTDTDKEIADADARLDTYWWDLWEYFVSTPLKKVKERHKLLPHEFKVDDLVLYFSSMKNQLHLDLAMLIEDELCDERDAMLDADEHVQKAIDALNHGPQNNERKNILGRFIDSKKWEIYKRLLLRDYFTNKTWKKSLDHFVGCIQEERSFFQALWKTQSKTLTQTVTTWRDRFRLYQLIERWIAFSPSYNFEGEWNSILRGTIDYGVKMLKLDIYQPNQVHIESLLKILIQRIMIRYTSSWHEDRFNWIIEYCILCLAPFIASHKKFILGGEYEDQNISLSSDHAELLRQLWDIVIYDRPPLDEYGFYGNYPWRFTMEEWRQWNRATELLANSDIDDFLREFKKLRHHKEFFRYQFNLRSSEIGQLIYQSIGALTVKELQQSQQYLDIAKEKNNQLREYIVHAYPVWQKKSGLEKISRAEQQILHQQAKIDGTNLDKKTFLTSEEQQATSWKKIGRNELCPCGSNQKYKKCCWW